MVVEVFHDALGKGQRRQFQRWLVQNPDGFYINRRSAARMTLHRSRCRHLEPKGPGSTTRRMKICLGDRRAVDAWAWMHGGLPASPCKSCSPGM